MGILIKKSTGEPYQLCPVRFTPIRGFSSASLSVPWSGRWVRPLISFDQIIKEVEFRVGCPITYEPVDRNVFTILNVKQVIPSLATINHIPYRMIVSTKDVLIVVT